MDIANVKQSSERNIFFWLFLGPLSLVALFQILFIYYPSTSWVLPTSLFTGFVAIWLMRLPGLILAHGLLLGSAIYSYYTYHGALFSYELAHLSVLIGFWVTYLSLQEADFFLQILKSDGERHFKSSNLAAQEVERLNTSSQAKYDQLLKKLQDAELLLHQKEEESQSFESIYELSRIELISALSKHEELSREHFQLKEEVKKLKAEDQSQVLKAELEELRQKAGRLSEEKYLLEKRLDDVQKQHALQLEQIAASAKEIPAVEAPPSEENMVQECTDTNFRILYGKWKQLRAQFEEKAELLAETRKELFHLQEEKSFRELQEQEAPLSLEALARLQEERDTLQAENEALRLHLSLLE